MTTFPGEGEHASAVLLALNNANAHAFMMDGLPATLPNYYVTVMLSRRFGGQIMVGALPGTRLWRIVVRYVGRQIQNCELLADRTHAALEGARLTVGAYESTPIQFESSEPIGRDDEGYWSGLSTWTYVI